MNRTRLKNVQRATHVPGAERLHRGEPLFRDLHALARDDVLDALADALRAERREPEPRASRLQRRDDLRDVVSDEAEARVFRVFFNDATQRELRVFRHAVALVEDDELEPGRVEAHRGREGLDLVPHDVDAAVCEEEEGKTAAAAR